MQPLKVVFINHIKYDNPMPVYIKSDMFYIILKLSLMLASNQLKKLRKGFL